MIAKGQIYYRYITNSIEMIRIKKLQNSEIATTINTDNGDIKKIKISELQDDWKLLNPDGYITFTIVKMNGSKMDDVIVTFHRKNDIDHGSLPYAVCRQSITDLFTNLTNRNDDITYVGCSVSVDTCPEDVNYQLCTACDSVSKMEMVAYYIGDEITDILSFIKQQNYDNILNVISKNCNHNIYGCCTSIKSLLIENGFEYDVLRGLGIYPVSFKINYFEDEDKIDHLEPECIGKIENIIKRELKMNVVLKYSKYIDMNSINMDHIMVRDSDKNIYIIGYVAGGYKNTTYDSFADKRDYLLLNSLKYSAQKY